MYMNDAIIQILNQILNLEYIDDVGVMFVIG